MSRSELMAKYVPSGGNPEKIPKNVKKKYPGHKNPKIKKLKT